MNGSFVLLISCVLTLVLWAPALAATPSSEWTRFRGPDGNGLGSATNLPTAWTEQDYRWKVPLPGTGHASPVISGDRIFVTSGDEATAKRLILCLSTIDGHVLWQREFESKSFPKNRDNSYASATPAVDAHRVYLYWTTPDEVTLLALDHEGKDCWQRNLGPFKSQHGSGTSPIVFEDLVVLGNDQDGPSFLIAVDAKTGATRWQLNRRSDRVAYSTPCLRQTEAGKPELVFTSSSQGMSGVDPRTGTLNWELTNAFPYRVVGSPIVADGFIIATCGEGGIGKRLVAVHPGSPQEPPRLVYEMKSNLPYVPTPLAVGGLLFLWGDNGLVSCHRPATGERLWQERIRDSFYSSPVCADGHLYCPSKQGVVYVLAAADQLRLISSVPLGEPGFATPAIADGVLYLRTQSHLFALGSRERQKVQ
jgi:outer membrane protein assembly factor BamB